MFDCYRDFFSVWSDVFYRFFGLASNDEKVSGESSVTSLQDVDPNDLA